MPDIEQERRVWSAPHPDHMADCQRFPTGWLCNTECPVPAEACIHSAGGDHA